MSKFKLKVVEESLVYEWFQNDKEFVFESYYI